MIRSASANAPQMTGLWWEVHSTSGKIDESMGADICDFDDYNINRRFFSSLVDMNTAPDESEGRCFATSSFILPTEVSVTNCQLTVCGLVPYGRAATMVNTGPSVIYVGQSVGLVPPLSRKDVYSSTACESGDGYVFPHTVAIEPYNTELAILLKALTLLDELKNTSASTTAVATTAGKVAAELSENKIFCEMDTTGFDSKASALLHLVELMAAGCSRRTDPATEAQISTTLTDIRDLHAPNSTVEERVKAMDRIWRNRACFWLDRLNVTARCVVEESHDSPDTEVGRVPVEFTGLCKVRVL
jgi:hypothetical protein